VLFQRFISEKQAAGDPCWSSKQLNSDRPAVPDPTRRALSQVNTMSKVPCPETESWC